jgi:hypothetical protein
MNEFDGQDVSPPPRRVETWTHVPGHEVNARDSRISFCQCGAQQRRDDELTAAAWRAAHLHEAWPVIVPRSPGEQLGAWMGRISEVLVAASQLELKLIEEDGGSRPIPPGGAYPVMSPEYMDASERVVVLQHQLDEVQAKALEQSARFN